MSFSRRGNSPCIALSGFHHRAMQKHISLLLSLLIAGTSVCATAATKKRVSSKSPKSAATQQQATTADAGNQQQSYYSGTGYDQSAYYQNYQNYYGYAQQPSSRYATQQQYYGWPQYGYNAYYQNGNYYQNSGYYQQQYAPAAAPARSAQQSPITAIYTLSTCPHCMELKDLLQRKGVRLEAAASDGRSFGAYPTVVYSDGATDHGDRIYGNSVQLPSSVRIIETY